MDRRKIRRFFCPVHQCAQQQQKSILIRRRRNKINGITNKNNDMHDSHLPVPKILTRYQHTINKSNQEGHPTGGDHCWSCNWRYPQT